MSMILDTDPVPVEGCTRCHCGAKYWDASTDSAWTLLCVSCGEPYRPWHYELDAEGIPQPKA